MLGSVDLLVVLISVVVNDVEELELVHSLGGGDDAEPVTELHLLQELLGAARASCDQYCLLRPTNPWVHPRRN